MSSSALVANPSRLVRTILPVLTIVAISWWSVTVPFRLDDAYIVLHNARVLVEGSDPVYQQPALVGSTSPPFTAATAILMLTGLQGAAALRLLTALGITAYALGAWRVATVTGLASWRRVVVLAIALGGEWLWRVLPNGLETGWALAAGVWIVAWWHLGRVYLVAAGCGLLPCLRPELGPMAVVIWLAAVMGRDRRTILTTALVGASVGLPWITWVYAATGDWWPQTLDAKRLFFAEGCQPLMTKLATVGRLVGTWSLLMLPLSAGLIAAHRTRIGRTGLLVIVGTLLVYVHALPGAVVHYDFRYLVPLVVPWALYGATTLAASRRPFVQALLVCGAILSAITAGDPYAGDDTVARELRATAEWVRTRTPEDSVILAHDAGAIALFGERRVVDLVGLKTPSSIDAHRRWTYPSCGANRWQAIGEIARTSGASYVVTLNLWDKTLHLRQGLLRAGFTLTTVRTGEGPAAYSIDRLDPTD
jgi:hypothetical protein